MALPCPVQKRIYTRVDTGEELDYNQAREFLFNNPNFITSEKATEIGERAEVRKPDQETAKAGQERGISQGDSGQRGAQEVRQGEVPEVSGKGEDVTTPQAGSVGGEVKARKGEKQIKAAFDKLNEAKTPEEKLNAINLLELNERNGGELTKKEKQQIQKVKDELASEGYEVPSLLGKQFHQGMKVIVTNSIPDETLAEGEEIITKVLRPQINKDGKMVQTAQIEVTVGTKKGGLTKEDWLKQQSLQTTPQAGVVEGEVDAKKKSFTEAGEQSKKEQSPKALGDFIIDNAQVGDRIKINENEYYEVVSRKVSKRNGSTEIELQHFVKNEETGNFENNPSAVKIFTDKYRGTDQEKLGYRDASDLFESSYTNSNGEKVIEQSTYEPVEQPLKETPKAEEKVSGGLTQEEAKGEKIEELTDETVDVPNKTIIAFHATSTGEVKSGKEAGIHIGTKKAAEQVKQGRNLGKGQVVPVSVKINRPLVLSDMPTWSSTNLLGQLYNPSEGKYFGFSREQIRQIRDSDLTEKEKQQWIIDALKRKGYDAIAYKNDSEDAGKYSYVIFDEGGIELLNKTDETKAKKQPVLEGVRDGGQQAEGGQASPQLRTQEEAKGEKEVDEFEAIAGELGEAAKRMVEKQMEAKSGSKKVKAQIKAAKKTVEEQEKVEEETAEKELADEDSGNMIDDLFDSVGGKPKNTGQNLAAISPAFRKMMQPPPPAPTKIFPKEVQERMNAARKKPSTDNWFTKFLNRMVRFGNGFAREYAELSQKKYGNVIDILRRLKSAPQAAKQLAEMHMQNIWGNLNQTQRAHFQDYIIASDLLGSIEDGLYVTDADWAGRNGPFGFNSFQEVRDAVAAGEQLLNADPSLKKAVDKRNAFVNKMWENSKKAGLVSGEQVGSGQSYFHRKVLKFEEEGVALDAIMRSSAKRKKLSQFKKRKGSTMDYLTNFAEVEFGVVASTGFEIMKRQYINDIVKEYKPVYDSFKAEAKQKAQDQVDDIEKQFGLGSPEHNIAVENQKELENKFFAELMGDEYMVYFPDGKNALFKTDVAMGTDVEDAITQLTNGQTGLAIQNLSDAIKPVVMMIKGRQIFVPTDIANVFDRLGRVKGDSEPIIQDILDVIGASTTALKKVILLSPFRLPKYILGNFAGDFDRIMAADPGVAKEVPKAVQMLLDANKGTYDPMYTMAVKMGVIGSGTMAEIGDVSQAEWSKFATDRKGDVSDFLRKAMETMGGVKWSVEKYFELAGRVASAREDAFRLAAFIRATDQIKKGKNFYWFSNKTAVDQIKDKNAKAAKLAREIFGDYDAISQSGTVLAKYLYPFYRFRETNIRSYKNFLFNNLNTKAGREKIIKYGVSRGATVAATKMLIHSMQLALFTASVYAYNRLMWPDEEEELRAAGDQSFHIILGRNPDGSINVLRTQGTLNAFMESMGLNGIMQFYRDYENKDATMADVAKEPAKAFTNEFYQGTTPFLKVPFELASGKSRFPDVFRPRAIRDNTEYIFSNMGLRQPYEMLADVPRPEKDVFTMLLTSDMNPNEIAYYQALNKASEDVGNYTMVATPGKSALNKIDTDKKDALWRWKMNTKFNKYKEAEKDLKEYYRLGGKPQDIESSLRASNPLSPYPEFVKAAIEAMASGKPLDFTQVKPIKISRDVTIYTVKIGGIYRTAKLEELEYLKTLSKKDIKMFQLALEHYNSIKNKAQQTLKKR